MSRRSAIALAAFLAACAPRDANETGAASPAATTPEAELSLRGTLGVVHDHPPNGKHFDGVVLDATDGTRWVVSYTIDPLLAAFDGKEVVLHGRAHSPPGQAIVARHVLPERWEIVDWRGAGELERVGPEASFEGSFERFTWPEGTKLAGDAMRVFRGADGTRYFLARVPEPEPSLGEPVRVRARVVEPTRLEQRPGGPYLWVLEVEK